MARPRRPRRSATPLYDPAFEHDACGIGFVADAGGRNRSRVLGLALDGLAALGHRGAFGAVGEASGGAGVAMPLEAALLDGLAGPGVQAERPGVAMLFMPRGRASGARARTLVAEALATEGLAITAWRRVAVDGGALGAEAAASRAGALPPLPP